MTSLELMALRDKLRVLNKWTEVMTSLDDEIRQLQAREIKAEAFSQLEGLAKLVKEGRIQILDIGWRREPMPFPNHHTGVMGFEPSRDVTFTLHYIERKAD